jgi:voltage-gated potassium channel
MHGKHHGFFSRGWQTRVNLTSFFVLITVAVFVLPWIGISRHHLQLYSVITFTVVMLFGVGLAWENRALFILASCIASIAIGAGWSALLTPTGVVELVDQVMALTANVMISAILLWRVFQPGPITATRILGAISAYLGLALAWAHAYHLTDLLVPGSFNTAGNDASDVTSWINFSFGMLTTVGYEGIAAVRPAAHTLCSAETVTGQLYLTVLVARLVSMQISDAEKEARAKA